MTETDIPLVAAACVYVAAKAEETALHIKVVVTEARAAFNGDYVLLCRIAELTLPARVRHH